jgi:toxin ParE1/3/4
MDYRVFFTKGALADLDDIARFISEDDADAAERFGNALLDHVDLLGRFPRMGVVTRKRSTIRKLIHGPILVFYRINENDRRVSIMSFRHGARKPARS